jgi:hypothetical protein
VALVLATSVTIAGQSSQTGQAQAAGQEKGLGPTSQGSGLAPGQPPPERKRAAVPKNWVAPKTPWGHPDLQGLYSNSTIVPLERPANQTKAELTDEEVKARFEKHRGQLFGKREGDTGFYNEFWWEWGHDGNRTSLITDPPDGKLPWKPEAENHNKAAMKVFYGLPGSYVDLNILDRCISRSLPGTMMPGFYGHYYQILQTPDYVVLRMELLHDVRIIPLGNQPHIGGNIKQWLGDSRGHWEGDTLVVETTNMRDSATLTAATYFSVGSDLKLVERFRRVDPETIDYRFTVEAPASFTRSWTAAIPLWKTDEKMFEYACHEGNYAMPHSLSGARAEEAAQAAGKK